jgi:hypothetical protein
MLKDLNFSMDPPMGPTTHPLYEMVDEDRQSNQGSNYSIANKKEYVISFSNIIVVRSSGVIWCNPSKQLFSFFFFSVGLWVDDQLNPPQTPRGFLLVSILN